LKLTERTNVGTSVIEVPVIDINGEGRVTRLDSLAIEEPLEIRIGDRSISVTMRTPGHDEELAVGFLFGEGLIRNRGQIRSIVVGDGEDAGTQNIVTLELANEVGFEIGKLDRHFYTTSSCGVCGKASIEAIEVFPDGEISSDLEIDATTIHKLPGQLDAVQDLFRETGGLHAAALFDPDGSLTDVREDVGRHNAMDKLVGSLVLKNAIPMTDKIMLVSGRASFELVQKAVMAGVPIMAAVGAPSSLAVELAATYGMTLIGFLRDGRFNVYTKPKRLSVSTEGNK
jgi:FdhD protein